MRIAIVNYVWDADLRSPHQALDRFATLTGWAQAAQAATGSSVTVYQRFSQDSGVERNQVTYQFLAGRGQPHPSLWSGHAEEVHAAVAGARPDVVHVNGVLHPRRIRALRAALPSRTAMVVQDHGGFEPERASLLTRAWIRRGLGAADALLVAAPGQVNAWHESRVAPAALRIFSVMEGSTTFTGLPRDEARRRSGVDGVPALLWVGRLNANKDPVTVLRGVAAFLERHPQGCLTLVYGTADLEPDVRDMIAGTPALAGRVRLVGRVAHADLEAYYSAADFFVIGSHHEGSGYAAIEAIACGAFPVLTDIPSFRALTADGTAGALWRAGDAASLTEALGRAAAISLHGSRDAIRGVFDRSFSWPAIGRRSAEIYRDVGDARTSQALKRPPPR